MSKEKNKLKWFFQDKDGKYVIASPPNLPLIIIIIGFAVTTIIHEGPVYNLFSMVQHGALFLWSYLEIRYGESPFRRVLGVIVMGMFLYGAITGSK